MFVRSLWSALILTVSGCMSAYSPPAPVTPLLRGRGDVVAGAMMRPFFPRRGASAHVAAAPTEHTRVYAAGALTRARGIDTNSHEARAPKAKNDTNQVELGAGWGTASSALRAEVLAGLGYGKTASIQCDYDPFGDYHCDDWLDASARLFRLSAQAQIEGLSPSRWSGGGGLKISMVRFEFDRLLERSTSSHVSVVTFEPFLLQRVDIGIGHLIMMVHVPIVPYSPKVHVQNGGGAVTGPDPVRVRLIETPAPRIFLGFQGNLDLLWRD